MSDKYDEVAERIRATGMPMGNYQAGTDKIAAILRETFPAPSGQGEDERALNEALTKIANHGWCKNEPISNQLDGEDMMRIAREALRSRLAEPVLSDGRTADQALHDDYAEPAQAVPSEEQVEDALRYLIGRTRPLRAGSDSPEARRQSSAVDIIRAALASERAKREGVGTGKGRADLEALISDECARSYKQGYHDGKTAALGPAPDAAALREAIMDNFVHTHDPTPDGQEVASKWYAPKWGCDTLDHVLDDVAALLRSEPRGEEPR